MIEEIQKTEDFLGRQISEDDIICYPVRKGSDLWMTKAKVLNVFPSKLRVQKENGFKTVVRNMNQTVICPAGTLFSVPE